MAESARHSGRKTPWKTILAVLPVVAIAAGDYKDAAAGETAALQNIVMSPCPFDAGHGDVRHARRIRAGAARVWAKYRAVPYPWGREQGKETSRHAAAEHGRAYAAGHAGVTPARSR